MSTSDIPLENDLDMIHVNCGVHFIFQVKDAKSNVLFYACPRCAKVLMVGEIQPESGETPQQEESVEDEKEVKHRKSRKNKKLLENNEDEVEGSRQDTDDNQS